MFNSFSSFLFHFLLFLVAYFGVAIPKLLSSKNSGLITFEFWIKSLVAIAAISLFDSFQLFVGDVANYESYDNYLYVWWIDFVSKGAVFYLIPLLVIYFIFDNKDKTVYGLFKKNTLIKTYLWLIIFSLPFLIAISFSQEFQLKYPFFKPWNIQSVFNKNPYSMALIYELGYGLSFFILEWIFRGAMVIGMIKIVGKDAILPILSVYVFLHFGKPFPETLAAVVGGYVLSILAYYSKSILTGCLIHVAIAWSMDALSYLHHIFK